MPTGKEGKLREEGVLAPCQDVDRVLEFCLREPMRYRHIIHECRPPCPDLSKASSVYYGFPADTESVYYADRPDPIGLLAVFRAGRLRIEGDPTLVSMNGLREWCARLNPSGVATTNERLMYLLREVVGSDSWNHHPHYTATTETFCSSTMHDVVRLSAEDADAFESFLQQPGEVPFLTVQRSEGGLVHDLALMRAGYPMECYAVFDGTDIAGVVTICPKTDRCDEVSRLYVTHKYRGRKIARSLLSTATRNILARGRQPA